MVVVETYAVTVNTFIQCEQGKTPSLMARDYKDPIAVTDPDGYRVRRLIPMECGRLQGFPDGWCTDLGVENPSEEEISFWEGVFETHRQLVTHASKPRSRKQIVNWIQHPHTDGAEYKLWGNGCALPCVYFVMAGISKVNGDRL